MATRVSLSNHFRQISVAASPRPIGSSRLFSRPATHNSSSTSNLAQEVQQLAAELSQQGQVVGSLASAVTGSPAALANLGGSLLGGSVLGQLAGSAAGGFSWQSLLKDVLPLGGLVSEIAGLFSSPSTQAPLPRYNAPVPLGFSGVLGSDGQISQASADASGIARSSSPGVDLVDSAGGPRPAHTVRADGSIGGAAGAPVSRYSGVLDLSSVVQGIVAPPAPATGQNPAPTATAGRSGDGGGSGATSPVAPPGSDGTSAAPAFDGPWFMDHAPYIAAAVRTAMLDSHPIVDVVNDL
jgi:hypothetical protein